MGIRNCSQLTLLSNVSYERRSRKLFKDYCNGGTVIGLFYKKHNCPQKRLNIHT